MMSSHSFRRKASLLLLAVAFTAAPVAANPTESETHEGVQGFLEGEFVNVALSSSGELALAPKSEPLAALDEPIVWTALPDGEGGFYLGTGNKGKVYRISHDEEPTPVFEPEQVLSRALALGPDGALYVGTSPEGKVYRIVPDAEPEVFFEPEQHYIWDIVFDQEGRMYVATGAEGHIYRLSADHEPGDAVELFFESEQTHISTLAWDADGLLLAGTSPGGLVYRFDENGGAFAILNTGDREIRRIIAAEDGTLFVAAFTGDAAGTAAPARPTGTIANVISAILGTGDGNSEGGGEARQQNQQTRPSGARVGTIYRVDPDGHFEQYWTLPGYAVHSMALLPDGRLLVGTGTQGRLFSITGPGEWKLLQRLEAGGEVSMVLPDTEGTQAVYAFTSNPAHIYRMDFAVATEGLFTSKVYDAGQVARWGRFHLDGSASGVQVSGRSGNTEEPERTWSDWTEPADPRDPVSLELPAARYFQYRIHFESAEEENNTLDIRANRARFFYRKFNAAPVIAAIRLVPADVALERVPTAPQPPSIDLDQLFATNNQASRAGNRQERSGQMRVYERPGLATIAWQATDPNGDPLSYVLKIRAEDEEYWTILAEDLRDNFLSFNTQGFEEGRYYAKVIASDHLANPPGTERTASRISEAFLIDNTAPSIEVKEIEVNGNEAVVHIAVEDRVSIIKEARSYLNGGERTPLFPEDGFFDSRRETFRVELSDLSAGRQNLIVVAEDEAGNERVRTIHFEVD